MPLLLPVAPLLPPALLPPPPLPPPPRRLTDEAPKVGLACGPYSFNFGAGPRVLVASSGGPRSASSNC